MLTTLIYRSQLNLSRPSTELRELVERARIRNASLNITGVLLAKGSDVLQILKGRKRACSSCSIKSVTTSGTVEWLS